jgi:hypothetical protein
MNILGHYVGLPLEDLEKIKQDVLSALQKARTGVQFVEVDMGGNKGKKQLYNYEELTHELREINFALKKADPDAYGKAVKRIIPNYNKYLVRMSLKPNAGIVNYLPEQEYVEAGAVAFDPVEGTLVANRVTTPDMTQIGEQKIHYEAYNNKGDRVMGYRVINIVDKLTVTGLAPIYGYSVNDDTFYYKYEWSTITKTRGYYYDKDYQTQIAKGCGCGGKWHIFDYSGVVHDSQKEKGLPLSIYSEWGVVKVKNELIG